MAVSRSFADCETRAISFIGTFDEFAMQDSIAQVADRGSVALLSASALNTTTCAALSASQSTRDVFAGARDRCAIAHILTIEIKCHTPPMKVKKTGAYDTLLAKETLARVC